MKICEEINIENCHAIACQKEYVEMMKKAYQVANILKDLPRGTVAFFQFDIGETRFWLKPEDDEYFLIMTDGNRSLKSNDSYYFCGMEFFEKNHILKWSDWFDQWLALPRTVMDLEFVESNTHWMNTLDERWDEILDSFDDKSQAVIKAFTEGQNDGGSSESVH